MANSYTDGIHLMVGSDEPLDVLHTFAGRIGLKRQWFQDSITHPHYDMLTKNIRRKAYALGAIEIKDTKEILRLCKRTAKSL